MDTPRFLEIFHHVFQGLLEKGIVFLTFQKARLVLVQLGKNPTANSKKEHTLMGLETSYVRLQVPAPENSAKAETKIVASGGGSTCQLLCCSCPVHHRFASEPCQRFLPLL